jgi:hypothetical protein
MFEGDAVGLRGGSKRFSTMNTSVRVPAFSLVVVGILLLGVSIVFVLFIRTGYYGPWFLVKPGILVTIAEESGRLEIPPYSAARYWYQEGANLHSLRWAQTIIFLALRYVAPLDERVEANAPFGILIFLLCLLYMFSAFRGSSQGRWMWAYCLSALFFLVNYPMLTWVYHSGGWPGTSLLILAVGAIARFDHSRRVQHVMIFLLVVFIAMTFQVYHAAMVTLAVMLTVVLLYVVANSLGTSRREGAPAGMFRMHFGLAVVAWGLLFVDPLFETFVGGTGLSTPGPSIAHFIQTVLSRGNTFAFQVGYSPMGRLAVLTPLGVALAAASGLWVRDQLGTLLRREPLDGGAVLVGGLFLSAPVLGVLTILAGEFRFAEAGFVLGVAMPLLAAKSSLFSEAQGSPSRQTRRIATLLVAAAVVLLACFLTVLREPISRYAYVKESDEAVASWVAKRFDEPVFADMLLTALIIGQNRNVPVVSLEGVPEAMEKLGRVVYSGVSPFVKELKNRGASAAVLNFRNFRVAGSENAGHALLTASYFMQPLPNYEFTDAYLERLYDDGSSIIVALGRGR